jgi:protein O-mannosyl-transferase
MDKNSNKNWSLLICLVLTFAIAAVYYQVCSYGFVGYDDQIYVYENHEIQNGFTLESVKWALATGYYGNWNPLTWLSYVLDWQIFGSNAAGFHFTNLIFHILNTLLLFLVLKKMTNAIWQSAFVAALFALHPLHVEAVAWISSRKDVLSIFFWLLTMAVYMRYVKQPNVFCYLLTLAVFALGVMAKPMLVTLPFVLLLLDYWPLDRIKRVDWKTISQLILEKIPFMALTAVFSVITFFTQRSSQNIHSLGQLDLESRICNVLVSYVKYMEKMFWPAGLTFFYPLAIPHESLLYAVISAVLLLTVTILILRLAKGYRYLFIGWFWYLGTFVPVIGLVQIGDHSMADRYTYITLTGLFIIIAWGLPDLLGKWPHRKIILWVSSLIVLSVLAVCAYFQQQYWKDSITLCQHALAVTENNYSAHFGMAQTLLDQNRFSDAEVESRKYLQIKPDDPGALNILGIALSRQGKYDEAVKYYNKALQIKPKYAAAHDNIARTLVLQGKFDQAAEHFTEVLRLAPGSAEAYYRLGQILVQSGKINKAVVHFEKALQLKPDWVEPMNAMAWCLAVNEKTAVRNPDKAVKLAQRTCELTNYKEPALLDTLAVAYAAAGDFDKAVETAQKALELCQSSGQETVKEQIKSRLVLFKNKKPYIENE